MKREIKFRAWDKFNGCYWHSDKFENLADFFTKIQILIDGGNELVLQQYTGLKDKNGNEIYEGDLLELVNCETIEVSFKSGKFVGIRKNGTVSLTSFYWIYAKIFGNVYGTVSA